MSDWAFSHHDRVRYADVDTMRHVNNVAFVRFFESARIAFMHDLFPEHDPTDPAAFPVVFAELHMRYRAPAYFAEDLRTDVRPSRLERSSFRVEFEMHAPGREALLADGYGVYVGYEYETERAKPISDAIRERLTPLLRDG